MIYKPGQGYWTRLLTAFGAGTVVLAGVGWMWDKMGAINAIQQNVTYWRAGMAVAVIALFGAILFFLLNRPRIVDFMIATEIEMKKVHWPSWKEITGSTLVVIYGTIFLALLLFLIDLGFGYLFLEIGILESVAS